MRAKLALLPCIGQLLYLVAEQEDATLTSDDIQPSSQQRNNWSIPSSTYSLITKSLREGVRNFEILNILVSNSHV